jgi:hypothetical protein
MAFQTESVHEGHPQRDEAVAGVTAVTGGVTGDTAEGGTTPVTVTGAATGATFVLASMFLFLVLLLVVEVEVEVFDLSLVFPLRRADPWSPPRSTAWTEKDKNMMRVRSIPCMVLSWSWYCTVLCFALLCYAMLCYAMLSYLVIVRQ